MKPPSLQVPPSWPAPLSLRSSWLVYSFLSSVGFTYFEPRPNAASLEFTQRSNTGSTAAMPALTMSLGFVLPVMYTASPAPMNDRAQDAAIAWIFGLMFIW